MICPSRDPEALALLHGACFAEGWSAQSIAGLLAQPGVFALEAQGEAFVLVRVAADEAEIVTIAVVPAARKRGLGKTLMQKASEQALAAGARTMFLEVAEDNSAARALYAGLGFAPVGKRKAYYAAPAKDGGDALVLRRDLPPQPLGNPLQTD